MGELYKIGSTGDKIRRIQKFLSNFYRDEPGFELDIDGVFGPQTEGVVKQFQKEKDLEVDGIVGPMTLREMNLVDEAPPEPKKDDNLVKVDQGLMNPFVRGSVAWYEYEYKKMKFDPGFEKVILATAKRLLQNKDRYFKMEQKTRVPWTTIAALDNMESGGNCNKYLGNGQRLDQRTTIVPIGRGPFASWEDGALDALRLQGLTNVLNWSIGLELKYAEQFNGLGYMLYHKEEMSPYIWACSTINDDNGKYVRDGVYDPSAPTNGQVGVATLFKQFELLGEYKPVFS